MQSESERIIDIIEQADSLFSGLTAPSAQVVKLWEEGLDRLSAAIYLYEKEAGCEGAPQAGAERGE